MRERIQRLIDDLVASGSETVMRNRFAAGDLTAVERVGRIVTGAGERKAANLRANDRCALTTGANALRGLDVTVEGTARVVDDAAERDGAASAFEAKYGAHLTKPDGTLAGMGDMIRAGGMQLYRVEPAAAFAFAKGDVFSQTRYRFG